nr:helix-turn-helix domain-containing protein [Rhizobiaceae bacterium]
MKKPYTPDHAKSDWARVGAFTDEELTANALSDPDNPPLTPERLATMRRAPMSRTLRIALGLTQEEFGARYQIPLGTLRDWEQERSEPDAPARAYLKAIRAAPQVIAEALAEKP